MHLGAGAWPSHIRLGPIFKLPPKKKIPVGPNIAPPLVLLNSRPLPLHRIFFLPFFNTTLYLTETETLAHPGPSISIAQSELRS